MKILTPYFSETASVVAVSSMGADRVLSSYSVVGASKGALSSLARHLAAELAPKNVRVNVLVPGAVLTDVWKAIPDSERRFAELVLRTPIGRLVTEDEVASAAQFLCPRAVSGIVGQALCIDGGAGIMV